jgi:hypothetical protein
MAKAKSTRASTARKTSTAKAGNTRIVGANEADKQNIALAKESVRNEEQNARTTTADQTPEAKKTATAQKTAADRQFAKADAAAEPASRVAAREAAKLSPEKLETAIEDNRRSLAARGY